MNDQNHNNPPHWVRPIHSSTPINDKDMQDQDAGLNQQEIPSAQMSEQERHLETWSNYPPEHDQHTQNPSDIRDQTQTGDISKGATKFSQLGSTIYHWISMIGHCALVCGDVCSEQIKKGNLKGKSQFSKVAYLSAGVFLFFGVFALAGYFALGYRSLPVNFLKSTIETSLSSAFNGGTVRIDEALLQRDVDKGGFFVRLVNMDLQDGAGNKIAATPEIGVGLKFFPLLWGAVEPSSINILAPEIHFVRNDKQEWTLWRGKKGLVSAEARPSQTREDLSSESLPVDLTKIGDLAKEGLAKAHHQLQLSFPLSHIGVRNARVVLHEARTAQGDVWSVPSFTLQYDPAGEKKIIGSGVLEHASSPGAAIWVSFTHQEGAAFVDLKTRLQNIIPSELSSIVPVLNALRPIQIGVSGDMSARINLNEGLTSGNLKVALSDGYIGLLGDDGPRLAITRGAFVFDMEPGAKHIVLKQGELFYPNGNISLKGDVWRDNQVSQTPDWRFQLYSTDGEIVSDYSDVNGRKIDEFNFSGRLFASRAPVAVDEFRAKIGQAQIILAHDGSLGYPAVLRGKVTNVEANLLKALWPVGFNQESRDWFLKNVKSGLITSARLALQAPDFGQRDLFEGEKKTEIVLPTMDVDFQDIVYTVFDDPLPIKAPRASLRIKGKTLVAEMNKGTSALKGGGRLFITEGKLTIPDYEPAGPDGVVNFNFKTDTSFMDSLLMREPFNQKKSLKDHAKNLSGDVSGVINVKLPLREDVEPEDVIVQGKMELKSFEAEVDKFRLTNGLVNFTLGKNFVEAKGTVLINGVASNIEWGRKLLGGSASDTVFKITGSYDDADRNQLNVPVNSFLSGVVPTEITLKENNSQKFDAHVLADLSKASIKAKHLGWEKRTGVPATLNLDILTNKAGEVSLKNIKLDGRDLTVRGQVELDKTQTVRSFSFPNISYKVLSNIHIDGQLSPKKIWKVKVGGQTFDGRGLLRSLLRTGQVGAGGKSSDLSKGIDLEGRFKTVVGWRQSKLSNFKIDMSRRSEVLTNFIIRGTLLNGGSLTGNLVSGKNADPVIRLRSSDTGEALRFVGFYPNMLGGQGQLKVRYNVVKRQLATQTGELIISRFSIASDPVVKEVLSNISKGKDGGTSNNQDIVKFSRLYAPFSIGQGQFVLHDSQVKGELLGATMRGSIDFDKERIRLGGTYIPLYGLNAAVGAVPVLGDILVGRQGEGMLGITFGIYGSTQNPQVLVNPMSLVAPGVFRQIFEFEQGKQKIKVRPNKIDNKGTKLDASSSRVIRRKTAGDDINKLSPETSASSVQRRGQ